MIYLAQAAPAPAAKDAGDETIEIRHNPETGETSVKLEDVTPLEIAAFLALVVFLAVLFLVRSRKQTRR